MQQFYLSNYPIPFAFGMTGFREKPLHLKRNEVSPPMELQQEIFPFIETAFVSYKTFLPLQSTTTVETGDPPAHTVHLDVAKRSFLKLLLRPRRVILQDAAVYMCEYGNLKSPILHHDAFASPTFLRFKQNVKTTLQRKDDALLADTPPSMIQAMQVQLQQKQQQKQRQQQRQQQFAEWICQPLERQEAVKGITTTASTSTCSSRHTAVSTHASPCYAAATTAAVLNYRSTGIGS
ncbi:hypothetical protein EDD21DRAFT_417372 [Dissophora ornata]|nr:hypothetical protein EDD21DRAFT_417372 [Dissophora ornata]